MDSVYPKNIYGIKVIGIEKWFDSYYLPVTGREFYSIRSNVFNSYMSLVREVDNEIVRGICISHMNIIPYSIAMYICEKLQKIRLKEKGYKYLVGHDKTDISDNTSVIDYPGIAESGAIKKHMAEFNYQERLKNFLRTIRYNIKPSIVLNRNYLKNISRPCFLIGHREQQQVVTYCNENKISPIHIHPMLFATNSFLESDIVPYIKIINGFVLDFLKSVVGVYSFENNHIIEKIKCEMEECFKYSLLFVCQNIKKLRSCQPKQIIATGLGNQVHRLFCVAWRLSGGEVINVVHANGYCSSYSPGPIKLLLLADKYYTSSSGHEEITRHVANDYSFGLKMPDILHLKKSFYRPLFERLQRAEPVSMIRKVMVVCAITRCHFERYSRIHTFARIYHQLRVMKLLRNKGYHIMYKPRPDTEEEVKGIFDRYADEIIYEKKFEDVYHYADCLLFSSHGTTTFGFSMLTNKPIVLINSKESTWHKRAYELLKKRCSIVEAELDDGGKIVFSEQGLIDAIEASLKNINYEVVYEFAF